MKINIKSPLLIIKYLSFKLLKMIIVAMMKSLMSKTYLLNITHKLTIKNLMLEKLSLTIKTYFSDQL